MDLALVFVLVLACVPGTLLALPGLLDTLRDVAAREAVRHPERPRRPLPPPAVLLGVASLQTLLIVAVAAWLGARLAPAVGVGAPVFAALARGDAAAAGAALAAALPAALGGGALGAAVFLLAYYRLVRPALDAPTLAAAERVRARTGLAGRLLYGGVVEEVIARWGAQTLFAWLLAGALALEGPAAAHAPVMWAAIALAGVLFAALHLPTYLAAGCRPSVAFFAATLGLNGWASLVFGWLFWHHGLAAAVVAHALLHLLWFPFDRRVAPRAAERAA